MLRFLGEVRGRLPVAASIAVHTHGDAQLVYLLALGQLPGQRLVTIVAAESSSAPESRPEYVAVFEQRWRHAGYRRVARLDGGWLYRRSQP